MFLIVQIIVQFGSWDLNKHEVQDVIYWWIRQFHGAIHDLLGSISLALFQQKRVQLLIMPSPALPDAQRIGTTTDGPMSRDVVRNNWISAVLAFTHRKYMTSFPEVDFLDELAFTFPLYWYVYSWPHYPDHHYCIWGGTGPCRGHVGKAYMGLLTSKICPEVNMN